jgi:hypothetical protein
MSAVTFASARAFRSACEMTRQLPPLDIAAYYLVLTACAAAPMWVTFVVAASYVR